MFVRTCFSLNESIIRNSAKLNIRTILFVSIIFLVFLHTKIQYRSTWIQIDGTSAHAASRTCGDILALDSSKCQGQIESAVLAGTESNAAHFTRLLNNISQGKTKYNETALKKCELEYLLCVARKHVQAKPSEENMLFDRYDWNEGGIEKKINQGHYFYESVFRILKSYINKHGSVGATHWILAPLRDAGIQKTMLLGDYLDRQGAKTLNRRSYVYLLLGAVSQCSSVKCRGFRVNIIESAFKGMYDISVAPEIRETVGDLIGLSPLRKANVHQSPQNLSECTENQDVAECASRGVLKTMLTRVWLKELGVEEEVKIFFSEKKSKPDIISCRNQIPWLEDTRVLNQLGLNRPVLFQKDINAITLILAKYAIYLDSIIKQKGKGPFNWQQTAFKFIETALREDVERDSSHAYTCGTYLHEIGAVAGLIRILSQRVNPVLDYDEERVKGDERIQNRIQQFANEIQKNSNPQAFTENAISTLENAGSMFAREGQPLKLLRRQDFLQLSNKYNKKKSPTYTQFIQKDKSYFENAIKFQSQLMELEYTYLFSKGKTSELHLMLEFFQHYVDNGSDLNIGKQNGKNEFSFVSRLLKRVFSNTNPEDIHQSIKKIYGIEGKNYDTGILLPFNALLAEWEQLHEQENRKVEVAFSNILLNQYMAKNILYSMNRKNNTNKFQLKKMSDVWFRGVGEDPENLFRRRDKPSDSNIHYWTLQKKYLDKLDLLILTTWGEVFPSKYAFFAMLGNNEPFGFDFSHSLSMLVGRNYKYFNDFSSDKTFNNIRIWPSRLFAEDIGRRGFRPNKREVSVYWKYFSDNWYEKDAENPVTITSNAIEERETKSHYKNSNNRLFFESIPIKDSI